MNHQSGNCTHEESCEDMRQRLLVLLSRDCTADASCEVEAILESCPECMDEFRSDRVLRNALRRCCCEEAPDTLRARITSEIRVTYTRTQYRIN
ncbi:hypothetical protein [Corynebacterium sputi]|uniref:hypothetical protein n=1 Tax=Corynebacterium sputi TaxID=489915 RepID=UPI00041D8089|nr:hypothetical protein [Corynebacterium sputi]